MGCGNSSKESPYFCLAKDTPEDSVTAMASLDKKDQNQDAKDGTRSGNQRSASKKKINIPDTQDLFKSKDRNYSCSFLVNMDPSLMALISPGTNLVDSAKNVLVGHSLDVLNRVAFRLTCFCKKNTKPYYF